MLTLREISRRNVINLEKGIIIGTVDDLEFDPKEARVKCLVIFGRARMFGLLGRQQDVRIPWSEIISFGRDVIMVSTEPVNLAKESAGKLRRLVRHFWG